MSLPKKDARDVAAAAEILVEVLNDPECWYREGKLSREGARRVEDLYLCGGSLDKHRESGGVLKDGVREVCDWLQDVCGEDVTRGRAEGFCESLVSPHVFRGVLGTRYV